MKNLLFSTAAMIAAIVLTACGGGGGSSSTHNSSIGDEGDNSTSAPMASGVFLDSAVSGLQFRSGDFAEVTDGDGTFMYEEGGTVEFFIGDIILGSATGNDTLTPLDLVPTATDETNAGVVNRIRFLQTLDDDGDPSNGIQINEMVRDMAVGLTINFDLSIEQFEDNGEVQVNISSLTTATGGGDAGGGDNGGGDTGGGDTGGGDNGGGDSGGGDSGGGSAGGDGTVSTLDVEGDDTSVIGETFEFNYYAFRRNFQGADTFLSATSNAATMNGVREIAGELDESDFEITNPDDVMNNIVFNIFEFGISMRVNVDGEGYLYSVTCLPSCDDIVFDTESRTVTINSVTVNPSTSGEATGTITVDGVLRWEEADEDPDAPPAM